MITDNHDSTETKWKIQIQSLQILPILKKNKINKMKERKKRKKKKKDVRLVSPNMLSVILPE